VVTKDLGVEAKDKFDNISKVSTSLYSELLMWYNPSEKPQAAGSNQPRPRRPFIPPARLLRPRHG
jgi:hypothetical protein